MEKLPIWKNFLDFRPHISFWVVTVWFKSFPVPSKLPKYSPNALVCLLCLAFPCLRPLTLETGTLDFATSERHIYQKARLGTRSSGKTLYTSTLFSSFKKGAHPGKFRASPGPGEIEPDPAPNRWHRCRRWQRSCWLRGHSCGLRTHSCGLRKPACWLRKHSCWLRGQPCRLRKHSSWLRETGRAGRAGRLRRDPLENTPEFQNLAAVVG